MMTHPFLLSQLAGLTLLLLLSSCGSSAKGWSSNPTVPNPGQPSAGPGSVQVLTIADATLAPGGFDAATHDAVASLSAATIDFRLVTAGDSLQGSATGGPSQVVSVAAFYLSTFELTQGQWTALATQAGLSDADEVTPWLAAAPASAVGSVASADDRAAFALSYDLITTVLTAYNALNGPGAPSLRLATATEWEHAARAGAVGAYSWGDSESLSTVANYALVRESRAGLGVDTVAGVGGTLRLPNAFGFYDMAGNVWEWVDSPVEVDASLRGGSWVDNLHSARCSNRQTMDRGIPYAGAGVRLVLVMP